MIYLPGISTTQGEPFDGEFTLTGQDWTGYTGTGTIKARRGDADALVTFTATGDNEGLVSYSLTAAQTEELPALPRSGFAATCVGQIILTDGSDVQTFQFPVGVAGLI